MHRRMSLAYEVKKVATCCYLRTHQLRYLKIADSVGSWGQLRMWYLGRYSVLGHIDNEVVFQPVKEKKND